MGALRGVGTGGAGGVWGRRWEEDGTGGQGEAGYRGWGHFLGRLGTPL